MLETNLGEELLNKTKNNNDKIADNSQYVPPTTLRHSGGKLKKKKMSLVKGLGDVKGTIKLVAKGSGGNYENEEQSIQLFHSTVF